MNDKVNQILTIISEWFFALLFTASAIISIITYCKVSEMKHDFDKIKYIETKMQKAYEQERAEGDAGFTVVYKLHN